MMFGLQLTAILRMLFFFFGPKRLPVTGTLLEDAELL